MRERLTEWAYESPIFKARYIERHVGRFYLMAGVWPLSWSIGLMIAGDGVEFGLGPIGVHVA